MKQSPEAAERHIKQEVLGADPNKSLWRRDSIQGLELTQQIPPIGTRALPARRRRFSNPWRRRRLEEDREDWEAQLAMLEVPKKPRKRTSPEKLPRPHPPSPPISPQPTANNMDLDHDLADWIEEVIESHDDFVFARKNSTKFLQAEQDSPELHHTAQINPDPDDLLEKQRPFQLIRATPPSSRQWRFPRTRTHLSHSLHQIYTDYLLRADVVDDINHMLGLTHNWSPDDAYEIMQSFERDSINAGRRVRFIPVHRESRHWLLRIENPSFGTQNSGGAQSSQGLSINEYRRGLLQLYARNARDRRLREKRMKSERESKSVASLPAPPTATTQTETKPEVMEGVKSHAQSPGAMVSSKAKGKAPVSSPAPLSLLCAPVTSSRGKEAYSGSLVPSAAGLPKARGSPGLAPPVEPDKRRLKPAEWEKVEPLQPFESLQPPPTPRISAKDLAITNEERNQLQAVKPTSMGPPPRPSERPKLSTIKKERKRPIPSIPPEPKSKAQSKYVTVTTHTPNRFQFLSKALPPEATQAKHLTEERAKSKSSIAYAEKHRVTISDMLTPSSVEAAKKRRRERRQQLESWQADPDGH